MSNFRPWMPHAPSRLSYRLARRFRGGAPHIGKDHEVIGLRPDPRQRESGGPRVAGGEGREEAAHTRLPVHLGLSPQASVEDDPGRGVEACC